MTPVFQLFVAKNRINFSIYNIQHILVVGSFLVKSTALWWNAVKKIKITFFIFLKWL